MKRRDLKLYVNSFNFSVCLIAIGISNLGFILGILSEGQFTAVLLLLCILTLLVRPKSFYFSQAELAIITLTLLLGIPYSNIAHADFKSLTILILKLVIILSLFGPNFNYRSHHETIARFLTMIVIVEVLIYFIFQTLNFSIADRKLFYEAYSGIRFGGFSFELVDQVTFLIISLIFVAKSNAKRYNKVLIFTAMLFLILKTSSNFVYITSINLAIFFSVNYVVPQKLLRFLIFVTIGCQSLIVTLAVTTLPYFEFISLTSDERMGARLLPNLYLFECVTPFTISNFLFGYGIIDFQSFCGEANRYLTNASGSSKLIVHYGIVIFSTLLIYISSVFSKLNGMYAGLAVVLMTYVGNQASYSNLSILLLFIYLLYREKQIHA